MIFSQVYAGDEPKENSKMEIDDMRVYAKREERKRLPRLTSTYDTGKEENTFGRPGPVGRQEGGGPSGAPRPTCTSRLRLKLLSDTRALCALTFG